MINAFQWNCFNLVDTCNIALILFFKCDVSKFRIPPLPLSHNATPRLLPPPPLTCDVICGCPLIGPVFDSGLCLFIVEVRRLSEENGVCLSKY